MDYFYSATEHRTRGALWPILAPARIVRRAARTPHYDGVAIHGKAPAIVAICGLAPIDIQLVDPRKSGIEKAIDQWSCDCSPRKHPSQGRVRALISLNGVTPDSCRASYQNAHETGG